MKLIMKPYWKGKKHSPEARENMSKAQFKRFEDPREREKISVTLNEFNEKQRQKNGMKNPDRNHKIANGSN